MLRKHGLTFVLIVAAFSFLGSAIRSNKSLAIFSEAKVLSPVNNWLPIFHPFDVPKYESQLTPLRLRSELAVNSHEIMELPQVTDSSEQLLPSLPLIANILNLTIEGSPLRVLLDGRHSYDPENGPLQFQWYVIKGPSNTYTANFSAAMAPATEIQFDTPGEYTIGLVVFNQNQKSRPAVIALHVEGRRGNLVAKITSASDKAMSAKNVFSLNALKSHSSSPGSLNYLWQLVDAPEGVSKSDFTSQAVAVQLTASSPGLYRISLSVADSLGQKATDEWSYYQPFLNGVELNISNIEDRVVNVGDAVALGVYKAEAPLDHYKWMWTVLHSPGGANLPTNVSSSYFAWQANVVGNYWLRLSIASPENIEVFRQTIRVAVIGLPVKRALSNELIKMAEEVESEEISPVIDAGEDQSHCWQPGALKLQVDGSKSSAPLDSDIVKWSVAKAENISDVNILYPNQLRTEILVTKRKNFKLKLSYFRQNTEIAFDEIEIKLLPTQLRLPIFEAKWPDDITQASDTDWYGSYIVHGLNVNDLDSDLDLGLNLNPTKFVAQYSASILSPGEFYNIRYSVKNNRTGRLILPEKIKSIQPALHKTFLTWLEIPPGEIYDREQLVGIYATDSVSDLAKSSNFVKLDWPISKNTVFKKEASSVFVSEKKRQLGEDSVLFESAGVNNQLHFIKYLQWHKYLGVSSETAFEVPVYVYKERLEHGISCFEPGWQLPGSN